MSSARAQAGTQDHRLTLNSDSPAIHAEIDPLRLEQVVTNLLDNAIKYSPEGGPVEVELRESSGVLRLSVTDHGIGIPTENRERIFDRFYQAHTGLSVGGMGLGLYISRQIAELHGGTLDVEFLVEGGTRFIVTLPVRPPESTAETEQDRGAA